MMTSDLWIVRETINQSCDETLHQFDVLPDFRNILGRRVRASGALISISECQQRGRVPIPLEHVRTWIHSMARREAVVADIRFARVRLALWREGHNPHNVRSQRG